MLHDAPLVQTSTVADCQPKCLSKSDLRRRQHIAANVSHYSTRSCASASSRSSRCMYLCVVEMLACPSSRRATPVLDYSKKQSATVGPTDTLSGTRSTADGISEKSDTRGDGPGSSASRSRPSATQRLGIGVADGGRGCEGGGATAGRRKPQRQERFYVQVLRSLIAKLQAVNQSGDTAAMFPNDARICCSTMVRYLPPWDMSSACVPVWLIRPPSSTTITPARATVLRR